MNKLYFRLKSSDQAQQLNAVIWHNRIPCTYFVPDIFYTTLKGKEKIEELGIALEVVEARDLGKLSPEERWAIKRKRLAELDSQRKGVIAELRAKYGRR